MDPNVFLILRHKQDGTFVVADCGVDLRDAISLCDHVSSLSDTIASSIVRIDLTEKMTAIYVSKSPSNQPATIQQ